MAIELVLFNDQGIIADLCSRPNVLVKRFHFLGDYNNFAIIRTWQQHSISKEWIFINIQWLQEFGLSSAIWVVGGVGGNDSVGIIFTEFLRISDQKMRLSIIQSLMDLHVFHLSCLQVIMVIILKYMSLWKLPRG